MNEIEAFGEHKARWITISSDEYESMKSTLEVLSDPELMEQRAYFLIVTSNMSPINVPIMNMTTRIITVMNIPIAVADEYISPIMNTSISNSIFSALKILQVSNNGGRGRTTCL
jgi:hypothetical protein